MEGGEVAHWLRAHTVSQRTGIQFPAPKSDISPWDIKHSGLHGYLCACTHTYYTQTETHSLLSKKTYIFYQCTGGTQSPEVR